VCYLTGIFSGQFFTFTLVVLAHDLLVLLPHVLHLAGLELAASFDGVVTEVVEL